MLPRRMVPAGLAIAVLGWGAPAEAATEQAHLTASDAAAADRFGYSVALDGDTAVVGAITDDTAAGTNAGSAYVFTRSGGTWTQQAHLTASDAAAFDLFGYSVALEGDNAVAGAYLDDTAAGTNAGSAYVFTRSGATWTQQKHLSASDAAAQDYFGFSVALDGDTAVVGAWGDDTAAGLDAGSAYVFTRTGAAWTQEAKLTASDAAPLDLFGYSVALQGDNVVVGAALDDTASGMDSGSAYVFTRTGGTWTQQAKLTASDAAPQDLFGYSVALDGDTSVVGALGDDTAAVTDAGSAYVFTRSGGTWTQQAHLTASDAAAFDWFGYSVALDGDTAVAGAYRDDTAASADAGSAYVFTRSGGTWTQQAKLTASDAAADDLFGFSVALDGDTAVSGAYGDDTAAGVDAGSAYVFADLSCGEDGLDALDGTPAEGGASGTIHDGVEPLLGGFDPSLAGAAHDLNCGVVVPAEQVLDGL